MGIDAQTYSSIFPKKMIGHAHGRKALELINKKAQIWAQSVGLEIFYTGEISKSGTLVISIYPLADDIFIDVSENGISAGFRTSNGGPGYHAAVIDLFDYLSSELKMQWIWGVAGDDCHDETSYAVERDFNKLQDYMSGFLKSLMKSVVEQEMDGGSICIPLGLGLKSEFISCPLGAFPSEFPRKLLKTDEDGRRKLASTFFCWWNKDKDALFWQSLLRGLLWQNAQFREQLIDEELTVLNRIRYIVRKLNSDFSGLPEDLQAAINELETAVSSGHYTDISQIGYLKQNVWWNPFPNWKIELPGKMIPHEHDENEAAIYYDDQMVLRVTSATATKADDSPFSWPAGMADAEQFAANGLIWRYELPGAEEKDGISQFALVQYEDPDKRHILMLTLTVSSKDQLVNFDKWIKLIRFRP